jgi:hypothetical protein
MGRSLVARIHNPHGYECACALEDWKRRRQPDDD